MIKISPSRTYRKSLTTRMFATSWAMTETDTVAEPSTEAIMVAVGLPLSAFKSTTAPATTETTASRTGVIFSFVAFFAVKYSIIPSQYNIIFYRRELLFTELAELIAEVDMEVGKN